MHSIRGMLVLQVSPFHQQRKGVMTYALQCLDPGGHQRLEMSIMQICRELLYCIIEDSSP